MVITLADWQFCVDVEATMVYTTNCSRDHCTCAYCRNYYEAIDPAHPSLRPVLAKFGINLNGPSELMHFEPTLILACYRVHGEILRFGNSRLHVGNVPLTPEPAENGTFLLWVGEMELPWLQSEPMEEVVSPANEPEFMERMMEKWLETREYLDIS